VIQDKYEDETLNITYIHNDAQIVDILTKPTTFERFQWLCELFGLIAV
jgi:hypothetical protein